MIIIMVLSVDPFWNLLCYAKIIFILVCGLDILGLYEPIFIYSAFKRGNIETLICLNFTNHIHFQSRVVVDRGSDTQLHVTENLNWTGQCSRG